MIIKPQKNKFKNKNFNLHINKVKINETDNIKYLGVTLDSKLNWNLHINNIRNKLARTCGIISKLRHYVHSSTLRTVYFSLFQSCLQYSIINWGRAGKSKLQSVQVIQNRAIRYMSFSSSREHIKPLLNNLNILNVQDLFKMSLYVFMYRYVHGTLPATFCDYMIKLDDVHSHNTRLKNNGSFYNVYAHTQSGKLKLQFIGPNIWNIDNEISKYQHLSLSSYKFKCKISFLDAYI
jgi:hypothetical protein